MRYLRYPFALTLLLTAAITGALLIGRAQPLPDRVAVLHLNDICKLPCWIGITPDVTTLAEAEALVRSVYKTTEKFRLISDAYGYIYSLTVDTSSGSLTITLVIDYPMRGVNTEIISGVTLEEHGVTMGNLGSVAGYPQQLLIDPSHKSDVAIYYSVLEIEFYPVSDTITTPIYSFTIEDPSHREERIYDNPIPWQGFKPNLLQPPWPATPTTSDIAP